MVSIDIADKVALAHGTVGRIVGRTADAYRPSGPDNPLASQNRFLRLPAFFTTGKTASGTSPSQGIIIFQGYFDHSYTQHGDYLVHGNGPGSLLISMG